jgi:hypothetical protein
MEAKLVGEELSKCRKGEGVNSYQNCKHLADLYLELLRDASVRVCILFLSYVYDRKATLTNTHAQVKGYKQVTVPKKA